MRFIAASFLVLIVLQPVVLAQAASSAIPTEAKAILDKATTFVLYSIEPNKDKKAADEKLNFYGYKVLGKVTLKKTDGAGKKVLGALEKAISKGYGARCFSPRHALHAEHGGKMVDLLICFECDWVYFMLDRKFERMRIDQEIQPILDRVLVEAKVPLAEKKK